MPDHTSFAKSALQFGRYFWDWYANPARRRRVTALPSILNLPITDNCNSRCVMCDVWKTPSVGEISASTLATILSDGLFRRVTHVGVSGGEPTLRSDLIEVAGAVVTALPSLRSLSITTHGFHTARWARMLPCLLKVCKMKGVAFTLNLSIDGAGTVHDQVRGIPGGYDRLLGTYRIAKAQGARVTFQMTVSKRNVYDLGNVLDVVQGFGEELDVRLATSIPRLNNLESMKVVALDENEQSFLADFLVSTRLMQATPSPARRLFYRHLAVQLTAGGPRTAPCFYQLEGALLSAHGDLHHCSISTTNLGSARVEKPSLLYFQSERERQALLRDTCIGCPHDQSGAWSPHEVLLEYFRVSSIGRISARLGDALAVALESARVLVLSFDPRLRHRELDVAVSLPAVLCIGMYGGEHVGDAAILGGVLLRMSRRFATKSAYVASFRPDRTRRWVRALNLGMPIEVIPLDKIASRLDNADAVVLAGGPMMELIRTLVWQLLVAILAKRKRKPFIVEGIGMGPFKTPLSRALTRRIIALADRISVRSVEAAASSLLRGYAAEVDRDPAFDYLEARGRQDLLPAEEGRLSSPFDAEAIRIGINLRPLWSKYLPTGATAKELESALLRTVASGLESIRSEVPFRIQVVFIPMNADQLGFSDLDIGHRLRRELPTDFPLTLWENEPGISSVMAMMQRLHLVVAMRLHACIFGIASGRPTIGLDYSYGRPGKVTALFMDLGLPGRVCRADRLSSRWLYEQVVSLLSVAHPAAD